jgi:hypothetical protein
LASLAQQVQRLKAAVAVRQRGSQIVIRVIDEDRDEVLDRMIEAGDITEAQRDQVTVIERVIVDPPERPEEEIPVIPLAPSPRTEPAARRAADPNPSFHRQLDYIKDGSQI